MTSSQLETTLLYLIRANGLPEPEREYRFAPPRRWRADFAYPSQRLLIEVEGGMWTKSRHRTGTGYEQDCRKYNKCVIDGWRLLRFTRSMIEKGEAVEAIKTILETRSDE